jgi:hypothetical protein
MIVLNRCVPIRQVGSDRAWFRVPGQKPEIEVLIIVEDAYLCLHRGRNVVPGKPLEWKRNRRGFGPGRFIEDPVHLDSTG